MTTPVLRTGGVPISSATQHYYARRVRSQARRLPTSFAVAAKVTDPQVPRKEEEINTRLDVLGPLVKEHYPVVPYGSCANLMAAFDKRCNYYSDARVDRSVVNGSMNLLSSLVPEALSPLEWTPELFHEWNSQFPAPKQARYLKVLPVLSEITVKSFSDKQIFVKVEALLKRHDPNWAPRVIYQSSDVHNALLGPVMQACTKRLFKAMDQKQDPSQLCYRGGYAKVTEELADYMVSGTTPESIYLESDFSSNDMTQVRDVHILEIEWLRRLGAPLWLTGLMLHANSFMVKSLKYGIRARIQNQLPTGSQSTTFRNTLWNSSIAWTFATRHGVRGVCLVLGDDMLMRLDNPFTRRRGPMRRAYEHIVRLAHMRGKVHTYTHLSECSFLSKQFIMTSSGFVLVPKLGKAFARFNARASHNEAVSDDSYIAGKALSYSYEFRHYPPISRAFYQRYLQLAPTGDISVDGLGWNAKGIFIRVGGEAVVHSIFNPRTVCNRDDATRFYHWKYGLTSTDVIILAMRFIFGKDDLDELAVGRICEDWVD